jgi:hypothetical protein
MSKPTGTGKEWGNDEKKQWGQPGQPGQTQPGKNPQQPTTPGRGTQGGTQGTTKGGNTTGWSK